ncbi:MAG: hypothetical protein AB7O56_12705 [Bauldia sp.]
MTSETYQLFAEAMRRGRLVACRYDGHDRVLAPVILGHTDGEEKALTFQVGGTSGSSLAHNRWRCVFLGKVSAAVLRDGEWRTGDRHSAPQGCVKDVDLDINPLSPYAPRRRL